MTRAANTLLPFKNSFVLFAFLLVVWGFYRNLLQLPEAIDELFSKPLIWLGATYYLFKKEGTSVRTLGITSKNLFKAICFALVLGVIFATEGILVNYVKYGKFDFGVQIDTVSFLVAFVLSFATAITEEITFRGYIFSRVWRYFQDANLTNVLVSVAWVILHIPVAIFVWELDIYSLLVYGLLAFIFSIGAGYVYMKSENVISPILLHMLWQWPIILFR